MPISSGTRLGPYEVVAQLGAGGMGEVYRARDTKLNRDVAIKILPDLFANDPERLARFTREAQTLAALNHPNIAHINGLEEWGAIRGLVMEVVEGDDLSVVLARGPMALADVLPIARQLADGLDAAHRMSIVHRDLKPANVKVRPDGTVKVLDFGLAKAQDASSGSGVMDFANSPTFTRQSPLSPISVAGTQMGTILGTAAYMAPEQARGKPVDKRADIWAYGAVLYEMLAGRPAFGGDNVTDILADVVRAEPDWSRLPPDTPASIRRLLARCLTKDPNDRLPDIGVARLEIADASAPSLPAAGVPGRRHPLTRFVPLGAFLLGIAATAVAAWLLQPRPAPLTPVHLTLPLPSSTRWLRLAGVGVTISPDGTWIAYLARTTNGPPQLFVRALHEDENRVVAGSDGATGPFFSPDSHQIGFARSGKLYSVPLTGGAPFEIGDLDSESRGTAWASDGYIYSGGTLGLSRIPASGGKREAVTKVDAAKGEIAHRFPSVMPGEAAIVFAVFKGDQDEGRIGLVDLATRTWTTLMDRPGHAPIVTTSGELLYLRGPDLMMVPFDRARRSLTGTPTRLMTGVGFNNGGAGHYGVSETGTLTYISEFGTIALTTPAWSWRTGRSEAVGLPEDVYTSIALSPDGGRLGVLRTDDSSRSKLAVWDVARSSFGAPLPGDGLRESPMWSADGASLIFAYREQGVGSAGRLFRQRADGTAPPEALLSELPAATHGSSGLFPSSLTRDGRLLFFRQIAAPQYGVGVLDLQTATAKLIFEERGTPQISPDGRWLAYVTADASPLLYLRPYPDVNRTRLTVSPARAVHPRWSRDGRELFFVKDQQIMSVSIDGARDVPDTSARPVLTSSFPIAEFEVHPDGERFLLLQETRAATASPHVILNWLQARGTTTPRGR